MTDKMAYGVVILTHWINGLTGANNRSMLCVCGCAGAGRWGSPVKVTHSLIRHISRLLATRELPSPFSNQSRGCHTKGELPIALPIPLNSLSQMNLNSAVRNKTYRIQE